MAGEEACATGDQGLQDNLNKMSNIWNFRDPLRSGFVRLSKAGCERFGTVVRAGVNEKSVVVKLYTYKFNKKYKRFRTSFSKVHAHDEENFVREGDKVVIRQIGRKVSAQKAFYVRSIIKPVGRHDYYDGALTDYEREAMHYNEALRARTRGFME